ncbi:hypothetical protein BJI69_01080 [Luteibacter rhizovicinus DSM 16549]|uniref:DUF6493 domain-containing protein n=1 Tax=Luteibacter rhizovicinus DSM 16549 TaxID=1440763 RepID=A0A0G9H7C0_9GAMM|nr:DUF6493 family protein [Luteibacter rhizovicinus]APG02636.1 hypothetical protein BJI69_01080 [Luteibacter rhizovicinus DSM 16549]KLD65371.1 hypothetical protein Y883_16745 [Luteibacter rhizovicinus DSM 16549]KLD74604.1 hypothetical protein Y886_31625 [Xanthomonas hyacinthi DSM 19077]
MSATMDRALDEALERGDMAGVVSALHGIPREDRAALVPKLRERAGELKEQYNPQLSWQENKPHLDRRFAVGAGLFVCGTAIDAAGAFLRAEDAVALARAFDPPSLQGLGEAILSQPRIGIAHVNPYIEAGLMTRPDSDAHTLMMMDLPTYAGWQKKQSMEAYVRSDPTLHQVILRVMEIEGTSDASLAAVDKYRRDAWSIFFASSWAQTHFGRDVLLDKALDALERDWPLFRSGWFSRFHERLAPNADELMPRLPRYLALCRSRISPTVGVALKALEKIDAISPIDTQDLLDALGPVMHAAAKGHVETAMKLMDTRLGGDPTMAASVARLLVDALAHADAGVQAKAIKRLARVGVNADVRTMLSAFVPLVAASNRANLAMLTGDSADRDETPESPSPQEVRHVAGPLDASRKLARIDDPDTLVERIAYVFENDTDIDAFEEVVAALTRMAPLDAIARARLAPIAKRLPRLRKPVAEALGQLVASLLDLPVMAYRRQVDHYGEHASVDIHILDRMVDTVATAKHGAALEPLDAATHRGGVIDPARLVQRMVAHAAANVPCDRRQAVRALLRLVPIPTSEVRMEAAALPDSSLRRAFRYALGGNLDEGDHDVALLAAAARIRHPGTDDPLLLDRLGDLGPDTTRAPRVSWQVSTRQHEYDGRTYTFHDLNVDADRRPAETDPLLIAAFRHRPLSFEPRYASQRWAYSGIDEGLIRYSAMQMPSCLDTFFVEGVRELGNNLDWSEARWQNRAYLAPLLDPTVHAGPMGSLLLALALAGKEPGQTALAVDALVQMALDRRLDVERLALDMRELLATGHVRASRYAKSLALATRAAPGVSTVVIRLLEVAIGASPGQPPRDVAQLLALLRETLLASGARMGDDTRALLPTLTLSGRAASIRKALIHPNPAE